MVAKTDCRIIFILSISPIPLSKHQLKVNIKDIRATSTDVAKVSLRFTMNWYVATYIVQQLKISFIKQVIREITAQNSNKFTWPTFETLFLYFYCWLWTSTHRLRFSNFNEQFENSSKWILRYMKKEAGCEQAEDFSSNNSIRKNQTTKICKN